MRARGTNTHVDGAALVNSECVVAADGSSLFKWFLLAVHQLQ